MHAERLRPAVNLWFASADLLDAELEPDGDAWCETETETEPLIEELEPACHELEIPAVELAHALPTEAWNLGAELRSPVRRAIAMAAAVIPLMLTAEPALAAEPPAAPIEGPAPPPIQDSQTEHPAAIWDSLRDRQVVLSMADGTAFRGTVLGVNEGVLVCARESDGLMVMVNAAEVTAVHVENLANAPTTPRPQNGQAMIVFGSIATAIGGVLTVAGAWVGASCATDDSYYYSGTYICPYYSLPIGAVGVANLAAGIPLLAVGLRKRAAAREAATPTMSAFVLPNRSGGVMGGVGIRF